MKKRISLTTMCVYSTGDTPVVTKEEQSKREHIFRLGKITEIEQRENVEVHTTVVVKKKWNPAIHRYAWLDKFKVRINSQEEFDRFYGYVKITKN